MPPVHLSSPAARARCGCGAATAGAGAVTVAGGPGRPTPYALLVAAPTADPAVAPPHLRRPSVAVLARVAAAVGAGVLLYVSFPPRPFWWLALPALAVLGLLVYGRRAKAAFGYGFLFGMGFLLPLLTWIGSLVGPVPWVALVVLESLFVGLGGAGMALVSRLPAPRCGRPRSGWRARRCAPGCRGAGCPGDASGSGSPTVRWCTSRPSVVSRSCRSSPCWSGSRSARRCAARSSGGARGGGGDATAAALRGVAGRRADRGRHASPGRWPPSSRRPRARPSTTVTIAAVQGNVPRLGLDFNSQRRAVLDNHVKETLVLASEVAAGKLAKPDLVIWPENSSDIDPLRNADAAAQIERAAEAVDVPILVGGVLQNPDGRTTSNSALVWEPGVGVVERADKRRVQPFGEYMPWREFFRLFSSYVDRAGYFVPGTGPGVVDMAGTKVGVTICWEVAFDDLVKASVDNGAQVLAVPSNNATFGFTQMTYQQMAMSQVRSVEHDRTSIIATTSGVSATIDPDGTVTQSTTQFTPAVLVNRTVLRDTVTLATQLGAVPEGVLVALGVGALAVAVSRRRRTAGKDEDG